MRLDHAYKFKNSIHLEDLADDGQARGLAWPELEACGQIEHKNNKMRTHRYPPAAFPVFFAFSA